MLEDKPKAALLCMSAAIHKVQSDHCRNFSKFFCFWLCIFYLYLTWKQVVLNNLEKNMMVDGAKINIRLHNYPETMIALKNLKAAYIGKA